MGESFSLGFRSKPRQSRHGSVATCCKMFQQVAFASLTATGSDLCQKLPGCHKKEAAHDCDDAKPPQQLHEASGTMQ